MSVNSTHVFLGMTAVIASEKMRQLMSIGERVARSNATVLILGESGSGKEVLARAIHHYSARSSKPWVDLNCGALPEHLIESELFGYDRGAFSGANNNKPGLFELAHQGTIFLDEVAELEMKMQVKLLRVLDGVPYYRLGGVKKVSVDVRIVAATNQELETAVAQGRFRSDLYHRLTQITMRVPPLRDRAEDVAPLAWHFLAQHDSSLSFSPAALDVLTRHPWPGNIRELRNVVIRAAVLASGSEIQPEDLPMEQADVRDEPPVAGSIEGMERKMIFDALHSTNGHQQKAAAKLGISRRTLSRKLKIYDSGLTEARL
ncbi:MAG TPA: sigma-54 dependent transcriptional regulator [Bryobacteraceae bacterium]|jgi:DNA-binding NtrC family response regulator|nr:sigma-54 dependent transcriptional regulator [Bryobacteraceae bacterium]